MGCGIVPNGKSDIPRGKISRIFRIQQWKINGFLFIKIGKFFSSLSKINYCFPDSIIILQINPSIMTKSLSYFVNYFHTVFHLFNRRQPTTNTELENTSHWLVITTYWKIMTIISEIQLYVFHSRAKSISDITNKDLCSSKHPNSIIRWEDPFSMHYTAQRTLRNQKL